MRCDYKKALENLSLKIKEESKRNNITIYYVEDGNLFKEKPNGEKIFIKKIKKIKLKISLSDFIKKFNNKKK